MRRLFDISECHQKMGAWSLVSSWFSLVCSVFDTYLLPFPPPRKSQDLFNFKPFKSVLRKSTSPRSTDELLLALRVVWPKVVYGCRVMSSAVSGDVQVMLEVGLTSQSSVAVLVALYHSVPYVCVFHCLQLFSLKCKA